MIGLKLVGHVTNRGLPAGAGYTDRGLGQGFSAYYFITLQKLSKVINIGIGVGVLDNDKSFKTSFGTIKPKTNHFMVSRHLPAAALQRSGLF